MLIFSYNIINFIIMKKIKLMFATICLFIFGVIAFSKNNTNKNLNITTYQYSDDQIKRTAYQRVLTKKQIYFLLSRPILNSINKYGKSFKCSEKDLRIATTAMICLETGNLKSKSIWVNNLIGIKTTKGRPNFTMKTSEYVKKKKIILEQEFVVYFSIEDCINCYYDFLMKDRYAKVRKADNYKEFLYEIQKAGYATDPNYFNKTYKIAKEIDNQIN